MNIYTFITEEEPAIVPKKYNFCETHNFYHDSSNFVKRKLQNLTMNGIPEKDVVPEQHNVMLPA